MPGDTIVTVYRCMAERRCELQRMWLCLFGADGLADRCSMQGCAVASVCGKGCGWTGARKGGGEMGLCLGNFEVVDEVTLGRGSRLRRGCLVHVNPLGVHMARLPFMDSFTENQQAF